MIYCIFILLYFVCMIKAKGRGIIFIGNKHSFTLISNDLVVDNSKIVQYDEQSNTELVDKIESINKDNNNTTITFIDFLDIIPQIINSLPKNRYSYILYNTNYEDTINCTTNLRIYPVYEKVSKYSK